MALSVASVSSYLLIYFAELFVCPFFLLLVPICLQLMLTYILRIFGYRDRRVLHFTWISSLCLYGLGTFFYARFLSEKAVPRLEDWFALALLIWTILDALILLRLDLPERLTKSEHPITQIRILGDWIRQESASGGSRTHHTAL